LNTHIFELDLQHSKQLAHSVQTNLVVLIKSSRLAGSPNLEVDAVKVHLVFAKLDEKVALGGGAVHLVSGERQTASHG